MEIGVKQAAQLLNVSDKTIYRWLSSGTIPHYRVGAQYRFSRQELMRWVASNRSGTSGMVDAESAEPAVSLEAGLKSGGIFYRVGGQDVLGVLKQMLSIMRLPEDADAARILELVYEREQMATTGVGEGIAFPHCRELVLPDLDHPVVALGFLEHPVDFSAIDKKPVSTVFLFLSPSSRSSIRIMSRLAYAVRQPVFAEAIKEIAARDRILAAASEIDRQLNRRQQTVDPRIKLQGQP